MKPRTKKVVTVLGSFLSLLPIGLQWYWGNMATYVLSYVHRLQPSVRASQSSWVISIFLLCRTVVFIASGYFIRRFGKRTTNVIGIIVFNSGICVTYFAIQHSIALMNATLGALAGSGAGLLFATALEYSVQWADKDVGIIVSFIETGYTIGAIVINQFISFFINPFNELPDDDHGDYRLFSEKDLLDRVPLNFLILVSCSLVVQTIGFVLLHDRECSDYDNQQPLPTIDESCHITTYAEKSKDVAATSKDNTINSVVAESLDSDKTPREFLCTPLSYIIWFLFFLADFCYLIVTNYYKTYGQLMLRDDLFLTTMGTCLILTVAFLKLAMGYIIDNLGVKNAIVINFSIMSLSITFLYLSPMVGRWLYFFNVLALAGTSGVTYVSVTVATIKMFGRRHAVTNTGLVTSSGLLMMLIAPPIMRFILDDYGWYNLFLTGTASIFLDLILAVLLLPNV